MRDADMAIDIDTDARVKMDVIADNLLLNPSHGEPKIGDVIRHNYCTSCGTCEAVCPLGVVMVDRDSVEIIHDKRNYRKANLHTEGFLKTHGLPFNDNQYLTCVNCYGCERVCPALDGFAEDEFDNILYKKAVRSVDKNTAMKGQDGSAVSQIAVSLLESGAIDCVIGVSRDDGWNTDIAIMTEPAHVIQSSGTKYTYHPVMSYTRHLVGNHQYMPAAPLFDEQVIKALKDFERIAVVGVPCQVHGARLLQQDQDVNISLIIGLICMESFSHEVMSSVIIPELMGKDLKDIDKMDINKGKFIVISDDQKKEVPLKEIMPYARNGCHYCIDYTSYFSDITVGSVGSDDGWSTVMVRTEAGDKYLKQVVGLEHSEKAINMDIIKKLTDMKHTQNQWDWKGFMKQKWYDEYQPQRNWGVKPSLWGIEKLKRRNIEIQ